MTVEISKLAPTFHQDPWHLKSDDGLFSGSVVCVACEYIVIVCCIQNASDVENSQVQRQDINIPMKRGILKPREPNIENPTISLPASLLDASPTDIRKPAKATRPLSMSLGPQKQVIFEADKVRFVDIVEDIENSPYIGDFGHSPQTPGVSSRKLKAGGTPFVLKSTSDEKYEDSFTVANFGHKYNISKEYSKDYIRIMNDQSNVTIESQVQTHPPIKPAQSTKTIRFAESPMNKNDEESLGKQLLEFRKSTPYKLVPLSSPSDSEMTPSMDNDASESMPDNKITTSFLQAVDFDLLSSSGSSNNPQRESISPFGSGSYTHESVDGNPLSSLLTTSDLMGSSEATDSTIPDQSRGSFFSRNSTKPLDKVASSGENVESDFENVCFRALKENYLMKNISEDQFMKFFSLFCENVTGSTRTVKKSVSMAEIESISHSRQVVEQETTVTAVSSIPFRPAANSRGLIEKNVVLQQRQVTPERDFFSNLDNKATPSSSEYLDSASSFSSPASVEVPRRQDIFMQPPNMVQDKTNSHADSKHLLGSISRSEALTVKRTVLPNLFSPRSINGISLQVPILHKTLTIGAATAVNPPVSAAVETIESGVQTMSSRTEEAGESFDYDQGKAFCQEPSFARRIATMPEKDIVNHHVDIGTQYPSIIFDSPQRFPSSDVPQTHENPMEKSAFLSKTSNASKSLTKNPKDVIDDIVEEEELSEILRDLHRTIIRHNLNVPWPVPRPTPATEFGDLESVKSFNKPTSKLSASTFGGPSRVPKQYQALEDDESYCMESVIEANDDTFSFASTLESDIMPSVLANINKQESKASQLSKNPLVEKESVRFDVDAVSLDVQTRGLSESMIFKKSSAGSNKSKKKEFVANETELNTDADTSGVFTLATTMTFETKANSEDVPRLVLAPKSRPKKSLPESMKEINMSARPGGFTTVVLTFTNKRSGTMKMYPAIIQTRFDAMNRQGNFDPVEMEDYQAFHVSPHKLKISPNDESTLYVTFTPSHLTAGIYTGALKIKSKKKVCTHVI